MSIDSTEQSKPEATSKPHPRARSKPVTSGNMDEGMSWRAFIQKLIVLVVAVVIVALLIWMTHNAAVGFGAAIIAIGTVIKFWHRI